MKKEKKVEKPKKDEKVKKVENVKKKEMPKKEEKTEKVEKVVIVEKPKRNNFLIVCLFTTIFILGGFIVYLMFFKDQNRKVSTVVAKDEYTLFSEKLKNAVTFHNTDSFQVAEGTMYDKIVFTAYLNRDMELFVKIGNDAINKKLVKRHKVAKNVLSFTLAKTGPGAYENIYYIKDDGTVGCVLTGEVFARDVESIEVKENIMGLKKIVSILQSSNDDSGRTQEPVFIDINGKVYYNTETNWD